ncbi:MAG: hypothetical protein CNIPEHKO_01623 [Anaerolineales bacterium]|nr:hypothetical protein [Anaerolineales bacterium]
MQTLWDYQEEQESSAKSEKVKLDKGLAVEKERQEVLENLASFTTDTIRDKTAWILNHYPSARDSDITLQLKYWETFENDIYNGHSIDPKDLYKLTPLTSLSRARAKIQNEYKLFVATPEVRERRGTLSEEEKQKAIQDKPNYPMFTVYMDDSGKNAEFLIIGSVWFLAEYMPVYSEIRKIKERTGFTKEFHFKELDRDSLSAYKEVVDVFWKHANAVSFKLISVPRSGIGKTRDAFTDMYYHLLLQGIKHEDETGRAPLPRALQVWIDAEETNLDKLLVENLKDRLSQSAQTHFENKLMLDQVYTVDSKKNILLQIADMFTGSVNRVLNRAGTSHNHKDELADYFLNRFGISLQLPENDKVGDISIHVSL